MPARGVELRGDDGRVVDAGGRQGGAERSSREEVTEHIRGI